jgi:hypothetical protein
MDKTVYVEGNIYVMKQCSSEVASAGTMLPISLWFRMLRCPLQFAITYSQLLNLMGYVDLIC